MSTSLKKFESILSPLELDVLKVLWKKNPLKVREIYNILKPKQKVALTSVAVILDRLHEKGIVSRDVEKGRGGLRYIYHPLKDQAQFERSVIENSVDGLINKFGKSAVVYFNERFSK
ncbi:MAG: BlaI/MecI/CopY family transcriptional regulator [Candidatus Woesearchaeota archaeon]|jgi:predicted transcriptional regulator|nr:BlaI/MecI/CopY family transcriptional regulator [Candidatus Woesearchaeota archaeon]MDP7323152.1 BlaI/MecI/CopY family transcriptional regulator [Candidatus Woesearchaeota archaeon]MDP7457886.1 BlaI/MecI/CopY family transcriptional regulator [Candidatus Woesearchaeota archaeon]|tara:strand:+ start:47 stop:397 length:351 start_codon:yes stop_codon:yes gene_type:complete